MFFDFDVFKNFCEKARKIGIKVPILPGIRPVTTIGELSSLPRDYYITLPSELVESMEKGKTPADIRKAGLDFTEKLCTKLIDYGVPSIHIYTIGEGTATQELLTRLFK